MAKPKFKPGDIVRDIKYPQDGLLRILYPFPGYEDKEIIPYKCKYIVDNQTTFQNAFRVPENELTLYVDAWAMWKKLNA